LHDIGSDAHIEKGLDQAGNASAPTERRRNCRSVSRSCRRSVAQASSRRV